MFLLVISILLMLVGSFLFIVNHGRVNSMKNIDDPDNDVKAVYQTQMNISIVMMVVSVLLIIFVSFI